MGSGIPSISVRVEHIDVSTGMMRRRPWQAEELKFSRPRSEYAETDNPVRSTKVIFAYVDKLFHKDVEI